MSRMLLGQSRGVTEAANVLPSCLGKLGTLLLWRPSGHEAFLLFLQEALSL